VRQQAELLNLTAFDRSADPKTPIADGVEMPLLGFGVWRVAEGMETQRAVSGALEEGYRHIDTAQLYENETSVGRALAQSGIDRDELFVTTKFDPRKSDPVRELEASLRRLRVDRVDLYLVHWPQGGPQVAWSGMERALERRLTRSIGVSNFGVRDLSTVAGGSDVPPAVNQIQLNPFAHRRELVRECDRQGVVVEAYSPLTTGERLSDPTVAEIARRHDRTAAQVMLRWGLQNGFAVIPKSVHRPRMIENRGALEFELDQEDIAKLDALDRTGGTGRALESDWWTWTWRDSARARIRGLRDRIR
jgi:diketogulonate reductase-like aldo/keto reductase